MTRTLLRVASLEQKMLLVLLSCRKLHWFWSSVPGTKGRGQYKYFLFHNRWREMPAQALSFWWREMPAQGRLSYKEMTDNQSLFLTDASRPLQIDWGSSAHYQHLHARSQGHRVAPWVAQQREKRVTKHKPAHQMANSDPQRGGSVQSHGSRGYLWTF